MKVWRRLLFRPDAATRVAVHAGLDRQPAAVEPLEPAAVPVGIDRRAKALARQPVRLARPLPAAAFGRPAIPDAAAGHLPGRPGDRHASRQPHTAAPVGDEARRIPRASSTRGAAPVRASIRSAPSPSALLAICKPLRPPGTCTRHRHRAIPAAQPVDHRGAPERHPMRVRPFPGARLLTMVVAPERLSMATGCETGSRAPPCAMMAETEPTSRLLDAHWHRSARPRAWGKPEMTGALAPGVPSIPARAWRGRCRGRREVGGRIRSSTGTAARRKRRKAMARSSSKIRAAARVRRLDP